MAGPSIMVRVLADLSNFGKSADGAGKQAESAGSRIKSAFSGALGVINQTGVLGPFGAALEGIGGAIDAIIEHGKNIGPAMIGAGAAVAGVGAGLSALGSKEQAAHQQLAAAIEATGGSYEDYGKAIEAAIKHNERYGQSSVDTQGALQKLTQATHDPQKAIDLLGTATDLAAAKHEDLGTAAGQLGKVYNGNTKLLKEFGINIDKNTGKTAAGQTATQALADVLKGQAAAASDTFTGKIKGITTAVEDQVAQFGAKYGPAIQAAGAATAGLGAAIEITTAATNALKDSQILASTWTKIVTAAQWLWNAAMDANPIMLVVIAVALLIAGIILLITHVGAVKDAFIAAGRFIVGVWNEIWHIAQVVFNWIKQNWLLILGILTGPFGLAVALIIKYRDTIIAAIAAVPGIIARLAATMWHWISDAFNSVVGAIQGAWNGLIAWLGGIPGRIAGLAGGMWNGILSAFRGMVNGIIDIWNGLHFTLPKIDAGPIHIGGETIGVPRIPHLAQGGLITGDGLVYAHAGEVISPAPAARGPAVNVEHAHFETELDIETFMRRAAWVVRTAAV